MMIMIIKLIFRSVFFFKKTFEQKREEIWEGIEFTIESDVFITEFYSVFYFIV